MLGDVHVVVEGESARPAVASVHGIPGSVRDFRYLAPALVEAGLCSVRIDMPGFGKTPASAFASTRPRDRAAFVRQVMRALGFTRFAVVGHSFGGGAAILCAAMFPDDVEALVCVNSIGPRRHRGMGAPSELYPVIAALFDAPRVGALVHRAVVAGYAARGLKSETGVDAEVLKHHARIVGDVSFEELRLACHTVACPALVVSSSNDPLVEAACSFALARAVTSSAPVVSHLHVAQGGHFLQKHEALAIAAWLRGRRAGDPGVRPSSRRTTGGTGPPPTSTSSS